MKGLWIDQKTFVNFADGSGRSGKSLSQEIATRDRSIDFQSLGMYLPNPDPVLKKNGQDIRVYRDLLVDDRVGGSWENRTAATLSLEWELGRGCKGVKSRQAKVINDVFSRLDIDRISAEILQARLYGYQPLEVIWERRDGLLLPADVVGKPQEWFAFGDQNELRFRTRHDWAKGEELPARKFLLATSNASYQNPYGFALMSRVFWPVAFKKGGWRFWVTFAEKYGQAFAVGKIRRGATRTEMDELAEMLEGMIQDAIAVIYDDSSVELKEVAGKGASSDLFRGLIAEANSAITTALLGHAGAGQSVSGSLGGEEAAVAVREDFKDGDKKLVAGVFNKLIGWIGDLNFGGAELPTFGLWEEEDVDKDQAERDDSLSTSLDKSGLQLTRAYYQRTYNLEDADLEEKAPLPASPSPAFSEPADDVRAALVQRLAGLADGPMTAWVEALRDLANQATSLEALRDSVLQAFPGMSTEGLAAVLGEEATRAVVAGGLEVEGGE